jgi:hypothetical protein
VTGLVRRLVPYPLRVRASVELAALRSRALRRRLARLAAGSRPIVAGPWLGEVGFEVLYWMPFLRWFAAEFAVAPERLLVVSRGGTHSWYQPFAGRYGEVFDYTSRQEFRRYHDQRVREAGEQKQVRVTAFERDLAQRAAVDAGAADAALLHPSAIYELFNPFWWRHLDEAWVHRHTRYRRLQPPERPAGLPASYVAVKFYFNDCFPATEANQAFVRDVVRDLASRSAVVSLTSGLRLDDHSGAAVDGDGVITPPIDLDPRCNLHLQSAIVAGASAFVGTYGGFSYLAPFYGVRTVAYHGDPSGFSSRHLLLARSALSAVGTGCLFDTRPIAASASSGVI